MISASNRWQSEIRKPPDGTQPTNSGFGTLVTASGSTHTKGSWTDIIAAADWASFTGDAFLVEINFNNAFTSAAAVRVLADIGVDTGSGYSSIIDNLSASFAATFTNGPNGINYRFKLRIPNGAKVGCRIQSNVISQTVNVAINLYGNPTNPGLVRAGTFVRTFGADTANTQGTAITTGSASEGSWFQMTAATADDLWAWEIGYNNNDTAFATGGMLVDLGKGAAASEVKFAEGFVLSKGTTEYIGKLFGGYEYPVPSGTRIVARMQSQAGETTETMIVYGVGGNYSLPGSYAVSGTVTIDGVDAADSKTVKIYAIDSDSIAEYMGSVSISGGAGGFTYSAPDNTRSYFASYENDGDVGRSASGTAGTSTFDITIGGTGGSSETVDPVITTISNPTASGDPLVISVYDASSALALYTLTCKDRPDGKRLTIYNPIDGSGNDGFVHPFAGKSTVTGSGTSGDPYIFTIYRRGRWPTGIDLDVKAQVVDAAGNEANG